MVYSRIQEQVASWTWIILMAIVGASAVGGTVLGVTVSSRLVLAGIDLICISSSVSSLLFILTGCQSKKRPRWLLLALCIGIVMIIFGAVGLFR